MTDLRGAGTVLLLPRWCGHQHVGTVDAEDYVFAGQPKARVFHTRWLHERIILIVSSVVQAQGISFAYGGELVLDDVSFSVAAGEFAALVGPNGSGKSTLLRLLWGCSGPRAG